MKIIEVVDSSTRQLFLDVVDDIYKNDEHYVRPLDIEIENIFNPKTNSFHSHGKAIRWILQNDAGKPLAELLLLSMIKKRIPSNKQPVEWDFMNA